MLNKICSSQIAQNKTIFHTRVIITNIAQWWDMIVKKSLCFAVEFCKWFPLKHPIYNAYLAIIYLSLILCVFSHCPSGLSWKFYFHQPHVRAPHEIYIASWSNPFSKHIYNPTTRFFVCNLETHAKNRTDYSEANIPRLGNILYISSIPKTENSTLCFDYGFAFWKGIVFVVCRPCFMS